MIESSRNWLSAALSALKKNQLFLKVAGSADSPRFLVAPDTRCLMRRAPVLLGWPGMVGIGLLTACIAFYFSTIREAQERLASVRVGALALQDQVRLAAHGQNIEQRTPEEQVAQFFRMFPRDKDLPQCMEKIFASAQSQGIGLEKGEYKVTQDKEGGLVRFQMTFPIKGDYPRIRKYLTSLTSDMPTLSLQQVKFKRQKVGDPTVEADINLVLFLLEQKS